MEKTKKILLFSLVVSILAIAGIIRAEELMVRQPMQNEIGKTATCPVMKGTFEVTKNTPVIDYKGKSYYFCCEPCVDKFKKNPDRYAEAGELMVRQPMQSEIGKTATCPVMGGKFEVTMSTPVIDYKGKSYYFCCDSCIEDFKKNPDKYAK
ncbi:MAG TPA: YHS domain-containing protein [Thermodesulfovibrionales bacterium]|nr:YHS domain-containing protein [Thermodesulfovibrionales bacterium]